MGTESSRNWLRVVGAVLLLGLGMGSTHAVADEVAVLLASRTSQVMMTPRDPLAFMGELDYVLPRPVVVMSRRDAVAQELLHYSRTMSEKDALRTARALCDEAGALGWDPFMYVAVIHVESSYNHLAVSPVGAEGLMQLMPFTAEWMAEQIELEFAQGNSFDPVINVRLGTHYLEHLRTRFDRMDLVLTAYNRGPTATRYILAHNKGLPRNVRDFYATKVLEKYSVLRSKYRHLPLG
ncbi:MAG: hypothetical protein A2289_10670 [Deltaproteobacteria bacterium RIFOXYA12_FULL_58_15]|nr:MAG: hypothetical protein A2289_10670 [Deltaproteobacteria bacterium RIFOXYA12_FULL_58_15]OGR07995.1 MAG: hypothetical protein A2341_04110 [Deltaproteobacteria bacterium RIFOXYB12_FULL_58_9]